MRMRFTKEDVALVRAAASLAAHAPELMRAAHLAERLEALAARMTPPPEAPAIVPETVAELPRAA